GLPRNERDRYIIWGCRTQVGHTYQALPVRAYALRPIEDVRKIDGAGRCRRRYSIDDHPFWPRKQAPPDERCSKRIRVGALTFDPHVRGDGKVSYRKEQLQDVISSEKSFGLDQLRLWCNTEVLAICPEQMHHHDDVGAAGVGNVDLRLGSHKRHDQFG